MGDVAIARAIHVLAVVIWIGGVTMVTTVVLPIVRRPGVAAERVALFDAVERRFIWQARVATLLVGASGFYMVSRLDLWGRFRLIDFWWMHAMVCLWLIFTTLLVVGEPLIVHRWMQRRALSVPDATLVVLHRLHWMLLALSVITVFAAVAGSYGMFLIP
jgi:uncharacterized membrane protein